MILSHKKKFIFIHVPKVAGTSVTQSLEVYNSRPYHLRPYLMLPYYIGYFPRISSGFFHFHVAAKNMKKKLPPVIFNNYFKFAFVRNPWDRMVSSFHYVRKHEEHRVYPYVKDKNFKEYLRWRLYNNDVETLYTQSHFVMDEEGNQIVDYIGKFENLQENFDFICQKIGIDQIELPVVNKTKHNAYRDYYDEETKYWIEDYFREDIKNFQYEF